MSRTLDRHPYDAGAFEDDYRGFDLQDDDGGRGPLILALAMGVLLISGAVIWNTYKQGVKPNVAALPVVFADAEPYKRAPDDAGGVVAGDLERRIYDQIDGSVRTGPLGEAAAAEPVLHGAPPVELRPGRTAPLTPSNSAPKAGALTTSALPEVAERRAQNEAVEEIAAVVPSAPQTFVSEGEFLVQVAALRSEAAADAAWGQFVSDDSDLFSGAEKMIQRADLGAKGVFYRLRIGAFAERTDASSFCEELKARDKRCIVVAR